MPIYKIGPIPLYKGKKVHPYQPACVKSFVAAVGRTRSATAPDMAKHVYDTVMRLPPKIPKTVYSLKIPSDLNHVFFVFPSVFLLKEGFFVENLKVQACHKDYHGNEEKKIAVD